MQVASRRRAQNRAVKRGHIVAVVEDTDVAVCPSAQLCCGQDTKNVSDFFQKHFVSATNVSSFARARKRHEQQ